MMEELEPLPDSILERVRSKFYSMVERMENAPSVIGSLTPEQKKRVFSSDGGETNGPPPRLCVFCLKSEWDKTPWCAPNPGLGCTYGLGHDYGDVALPKPVSKQPKRPSSLCTKCGLHPKNPASQTNGCQHSYDASLDSATKVHYYKEREDEDITSLLLVDKTRKILRGGPYGEKKAWVIEYEFTYKGDRVVVALPTTKHRELLRHLGVHSS